LNRNAFILFFLQKGWRERPYEDQAIKRQSTMSKKEKKKKV